MDSTNQEREELEETIQNILEDQFEDFTASLEDSVESSVEKAIQNLLSRLEFVLPDGTHVIPRKQLSLTSPDQTKVLLCYGGLRVDDTNRFSGNLYPAGWGLTVQTRIDSWEIIHVYEKKDDAVAALEKVKKAIRDGLDSLDL